MLVRIHPEKGTDVEEVESVSFASLPFGENGKAREEHLEDLIADNVSLLESAFGEDDSSTLLIIGRQVRTTTQRRMDLVALDGDGSLILIEVKRDAEDVKSRKDHAEIQAVRYAASLAKLHTVDQIVADIYGPYIQRFRAAELAKEGGGRTAEEWARRKLVEFINDNDIDRSRLNHRQEIFLVGAGFDDDTRSAAAWMARYGLPIRVIELQPIKYEGQFFLNVNQLIPPSEYEDFYVDLVAGDGGKKSGAKSSSGINRKARIRLNAIMDAGLVNPGDEVFFFKEPEKKAKLLDAKRCEYGGKEMPIMTWARDVSGWSGVNIYAWVEHVPSGRRLEEFRKELEDAEEVNTTAVEEASLDNQNAAAEDNNG